MALLHCTMCKHVHTWQLCLRDTFERRKKMKFSKVKELLKAGHICQILHSPFENNVPQNMMQHMKRNCFSFEHKNTRISSKVCKSYPAMQEFQNIEKMNNTNFYNGTVTFLSHFQQKTGHFSVSVFNLHFCTYF